ncbi:hypothetical protein EV421DRAFT_331130 [Armillaria borealis]|uniref:Secreted protein n=1 Tax=Armillaria borealis TaxID=47425 RepID=A0AA39MSL5_9AGAR|nr:hypothetical protein EV421DRAFT_331130 [Armillaria borealis]
MAIASLVSLSWIRLLHWPFKLPGASAMISKARFDCDSCARIRIYAIPVSKCGYVEAMIDQRRRDRPRPVRRVVHKLSNSRLRTRLETSLTVSEPRKSAKDYTDIRECHTQHPPQVPSQSTTRVSSICQTSALV